MIKTDLRSAFGDQGGEGGVKKSGMLLLPTFAEVDLLTFHGNRQVTGKRNNDFPDALSYSQNYYYKTYATTSDENLSFKQS